MNHLFHVSETPNILRFEPRLSDGGALAVWAIDATHLPNYLVPRECPRVCVREDASTHQGDKNSLLNGVARAIYAEDAWRERIRATSLVVYEFAAKDFVCVDANAGYFQSRKTITPASVESIDDIESELRARGVDLRYVTSLWPIRDAVVVSTLSFSCIRMHNAAARD
jgi:hypothetical protein